MLDPRGRVLRAALGFAGLRPAPPHPALHALRRWLDSWSGIGHIVVGMNRQGYRLHLTNIDSVTWRATFARDTMLSADGFAVERTPWRAVQGAAWEALVMAVEMGELE
jgi:hypothetical protein